jgi:hypothetical protein
MGLGEWRYKGTQGVPTKDWTSRCSLYARIDDFFVPGNEDIPSGWFQVAMTLSCAAPVTAARKAESPSFQRGLWGRGRCIIEGTHVLISRWMFLKSWRRTKKVAEGE